MIDGAGPTVTQKANPWTPAKPKLTQTTISGKSQKQMERLNSRKVNEQLNTWKNTSLFAKHKQPSPSPQCHLLGQGGGLNWLQAIA